jgi:hypothetical protein
MWNFTPEQLQQFRDLLQRLTGEGTERQRKKAARMLAQFDRNQAARAKLERKRQALERQREKRIQALEQRAAFRAALAQLPGRTSQ